MAKDINIKRGDTFYALCTYKDSAGTVADITNLGIATQIRDGKGTLISEPVITKLDQTQVESLGKFTVRADTDTWPIQSLSWDIEYTLSGNKKSTETMTIIVNPDITR